MFEYEETPKETQKYIHCFSGKPLEPFHATLANLMKIYALIHLEVFVNQKRNKSQNI